ncbi:MAG: hypothetical protein K0Q72_4678, partial [Armatimonadetes bacterium]|nr:hypothetical protein [Armatimonadota bacterium]
MTSAQPSPVSDDTLEIAGLDLWAGTWPDDGEIREHSQRSLVSRRGLLDKFGWFLRERGAETCGVTEIRVFQANVVR